MARPREPLPDNEVCYALDNDLEVRIVPVASLHEQAVNAQVMQPEQFERLTENIRQRGALESLPYCAQPPGQAHVEIVSGHHRVRAAVAAGLRSIPVLVDISALTRSQVTAKQIAHNTLVGHHDESILRQLLAQIESVDDLLETGLSREALDSLAPDKTPIRVPHADFEWRTVTLTFLPHQLADFVELIARIEGTQDLVTVAPVELFDSFARALAGYQRIKKVLSAGTAIALLSRIALAQVEEHDDTTDDTVGSPAG